MVRIIVELRIWNKPTFLTRQVDTQLIAKAHAHHIVAPSVHGVLHTAIFLPVAYHVVESPTEEGIARCAESGNKRQRRGVAVAANVKSLEVEAVGAAERSTWSYYSLAEKSKSLCGFEGRSRRIASHYAAVEQRFPCVSAQHSVVLASVASYHDSWVVGWRRHHTEHLTSGRLYRHNTAYLAFKKSLAQSLQPKVYSKGEVLSGNGSAVELFVHIAALYSAMCVAQKYLYAFLSAELFLVFPLYSKFAYVVARLVVVVLFNIGWRHLRNVAQYMGGIRMLILSNASALH